MEELAPLAGIAAGVQRIEGPTGGATVQWSGQCPEGGADDVGHVGARRGDDPGGERRGVEAVVDRGDLVLLDGPALVVVELLAGEHPEVVRAVAQVLPRGDGLLALLEAHADAARAKAYELLKASDENAEPKVDPYFQMNLVYLLRVLPRPKDAPSEDDQDHFSRHALSLWFTRCMIFTAVIDEEYASLGTFDLAKRFRADAAIVALDQTLAEFRTDPDRVYLTGMSMGGQGTWNLAYKHPARFAACSRLRLPISVPSIFGSSFSR